MKKWIYRLLMAGLLGVFLFSGWKLWGTLREYRTGQAHYTQTAQRYVTPAPTQADASASPAAPGEPDASAASSASQQPPIRVDFDALRRENPDAVAWLYCPGTQIHYPVVQTSDNETYLHRLFDGTSNSAGTLFADCRNSGDFSDFLTYIYGHNMKNGTMFGDLTQYKDPEFYTAHPVMWLLTPEENFRIDLLAGILADDQSRVYDFCATASELAELLDWAEARSTFTPQAEISQVQRVVALSTCSYEYQDARFVVLGSLVPFSEN